MTNKALMQKDLPNWNPDGRLPDGPDVRVRDMRFRDRSPTVTNFLHFQHVKDFFKTLG